MHPATPDQPDEGEELMARFIAEAGDPHVEPPPEHVVRLRSLILARLDPPPASLLKKGDRHLAAEFFSGDLDCRSEPVPVFQQAPTPPRLAWRPRARLLVGSGLAALAVVVVLLAVGRPGSAWAQVAKALEKRSWVHGTVFDPDGKELVEQWFSLNRELGGERAGTAISFHDYKRKVMTKYVADESAVYQFPEPSEGRPDAVNFLRQVLDVLRDPKGPNKFPFPGMELIDDARREMTVDGKKWLGIELTLRDAGGSRGELLSMHIRVDFATKLPVSFAMVVEDGSRYTAAIDYPDKGPADIYDLGVPRTAKVVDRMLSDDVRRVMAGLKAGRREFDDYCAIVIEERVFPTNYLPMTEVQRVWRKGPKLRIERLVPQRLEWAPPPDTDTTWWKEHQGDFEFHPRLICNGSTEYWNYYLTDNWKAGMPVPKPGKPNQFGQTVGPIPFPGPEDDPVMPSWCQVLLPEQAGHYMCLVNQFPEALGEFLVEPKASGGPPGTILLRGRDTNPRAPGPDYFRLWVNPEANYISMQTEFRLEESGDRKLGEPPKVVSFQVHSLEALGKSPTGHPYPTRTREIYSRNKHEMVRKFFVDFEAEVPDELFQPLK